MKRYIKTSYSISGDSKLLIYVPKQYKKYVKHIQKCDPEWNEYTQRWNTPIDITWEVDGDILNQTYQTVNFMKASLQEGLSEDLSYFFNNHGVPY